MTDVPWEDPHSFLGLGEEWAALERARVGLLPVPYEATTSYRGGARHGPEAILAASRHVELYTITSWTASLSAWESTRIRPSS